MRQTAALTTQVHWAMLANESRDNSANMAMANIALMAIAAPYMSLSFFLITALLAIVVISCSLQPQLWANHQKEVHEIVHTGEHCT